jgi:hypothetical protein
MLFKGLDAVSDSWLGVHTTGQRAGDRRALQRIRPLPDAEDAARPGPDRTNMTPMARGYPPTFSQA